MKNKYPALKRSFALLSMFFIVFSLAAQGPGKESMEKIKKLKIAFMTEELELTADEAEKFWPIYNEREDALFTLKKEMRSYHKRVEKGEVLTEEEFLEIVRLSTANRTQEAEIIQTYIESSLPVLGLQRTMKLIDIDHEFRKRIRDKVGGGR